MESEAFAPFFQDELVCLPKPTVDLLSGFGLANVDADAAEAGIPYHDRDTLRRVRRAIDGMLNQIDPNEPVFLALVSEEARYILMGRVPQSA